MLALAKEVSRLYPELSAAGGLVNGLQSALREIGSPHMVVGRSVDVGVVCARVEGRQRRCQAYIVEQRRLFVFDLWAQNSMLVGAMTGSMMEVAGRVHKWIECTCSAADVVAGLERVSARDDGLIYDARDDIDRAWRELSNDPKLTAFVREALRRETLRQLRPYGSLDALGFSRCTRYPFTADIPFVAPSGAGQFRVLDASQRKVIGRGDPAYAADLIEALLPPNCGPALSGTRESLGPLDT